MKSQCTLMYTFEIRITVVFVLLSLFSISLLINYEVIRQWGKSTMTYDSSVHMNFVPQ